MPFNTQQFMGERFEPVTRTVSVPSLKDWFGEGEKPVWIVKSMTGYELGRANEIAGKNDKTRAVLEAVLSANSRDVKKAVGEITGHGESVPMEMAKRIEYLQVGSVDPVCDLDLSLRIYKEKPYVFLELTNAISELTSVGSQPGKPKPSGKTQKSK